jgi:hypothetical protein
MESYVCIVISALGIPLILFAFGFWVGRCGRRIPVIDDNLPWTMSRDQALRCSDTCQAEDHARQEPRN